MNGDLDMNNKKIVNLANFVEDDNIDQSLQVINYGFFHQQRGELKRLINEVGKLASEALPLGGTKPMAGDLDTKNNKITNLFTDAADVLSAANVRYLNSAEADLIVTLTIRFNKQINESHISSSILKQKRCFLIHRGGDRRVNKRKKTSSLMASRTFLLKLTM